MLPEYLEGLGVPYHVIEQDTYSVVRRVIPEGRTQCGLCSRLRRGALYRYARENGYTRIALGHHRDDIVETLFLNLFHGGRLKAMAPKLLSDDGANVLIRPLCYVPEREIERYARAREFPIIPCTLCGSQPNLQRVAIGRMLDEWERDHPGRVDSIFTALCNVEPAHLADPGAFDFAALERKIAAGPAPEVASPPSPLPNSYWVVPERAARGRASGGETTTMRRRSACSSLLAAGIDCFIDLTEPGERDAYQYLLPRPDSRTQRSTISAIRSAITALPDSPTQMEEILDELDSALAAGRCVYLHCRAGIGRTNLVVGCWLASGG